MSYVVIVHLHAKPGQDKKMVEILSTNMIATHKEPGLRKFALHCDLSDPLHYMVVEVYDSRTDYDFRHGFCAHFAHQIDRPFRASFGNVIYNKARAFLGETHGDRFANTGAGSRDESHFIF